MGKTMRTITVERGPDYPGNEEFVIYAVNGIGEGLFWRFPYENAYHQLAGTAQYSARNATHLERKLRKSGAINEGDEVVATFGWPEEAGNDD